MSIEVFHLLNALEIEYWYAVDRAAGAGAEKFYIEDGLFVTGDQQMRGRKEIAAFYRWRSGRGPRVARHLISNPRLTASGATDATFECVMSLYAADGVPVLESKPAIMIADVVSACVLREGRWLFASHILSPVFMGGVSPTIPTSDQLEAALETHGSALGA